jgi:hypothetical protein
MQWSEEPNNDDVCLLRHRRVNPPALDKSEFSGPDPEKMDVDLIIDQLGLMSTTGPPSQGII